MKFLIFILMATTAQANFAPPNKKNIPVIRNNALVVDGIDQKAFNDIVKKVNEMFSPIVASKGAKLVIKKLWNDGTVNSDTDESDGIWLINAYGGLGRYPGMTPDAYMMVLAHELGHHLGGYPKSGLGTWRTNLTTHWASNEGESDYSASLKIFRRLVEKDNNTFFHMCSVGKQAACCMMTPQEAGTCTRTIEAGIVLANVLHDLSGDSKSSKISLETPDLTRVRKTFDGHPNAQCRLDTYYAGAICPVDLNIPFSDKNPKEGSCSQEVGDLYGYRPLCWYHPL